MWMEMDVSRTPAIAARRLQEDIGLASLFVLLCIVAVRSSDHLVLAALAALAIAPVPLAVAFVRNGNTDGLLATLGGVLAVWWLSAADPAVAGPHGSFVALLICGLGVSSSAVCGPLYGYMANSHRTTGRILLLGTLVLTAVLMLAFYAFGGRSAARQQLAPVLKVIAESAGEKDPARVIDEREALEARLAFWGSFPLFLAGVTALGLFGGYLWVVRWVVRRVTRGLASPLADEVRFAEWRVPWEYSWWVIAAVSAYLSCVAAGWEPGQSVTSNVALVLALPYAVIAFSIAAFLLDRRGSGLAIRFLVHFIVLLNLPYMMLFAMLDSWVDYRQLCVAGAGAGGLDRGRPESGEDGDE
jgi:hypothetical protein